MLNERHGLPVIGVETLKNIVLYYECPEFLADKRRYFVNINENVLKDYCEEYSLSLKDLTDLTHVSRETIYRYENGMVKTNFETVMLFEYILNIENYYGY